MRKPASREPSPPAAMASAVDGAVAEAARRLDLALQRLETSGGGRSAVDPQAAEQLAQARLAEHSRAWEQEKAALADQLRRAREREQALQQVATLASQAIGRATAEVRAALGNDEPGGGTVDDRSDSDPEQQTAALREAADEEAA